MKTAIGVSASSVRMHASTRQIGEVMIFDVSGRITLGEGDVMLREIRRDLADKRIVLNLADVDYIDSACLGELIRTHMRLRSKGAY